MKTIMSQCYKKKCERPVKKKKKKKISTEIFLHINTVNHPICTLK